MTDHLHAEFAYEVPEHCALCDNEPTVGLNGAAYCDDHAADGFAAYARADAIARGITDERRIVAMERAMVALYTKANIECTKIGDTIAVNTAQYEDDVN